jgi:hypothetical protein
MIEPTKADIGRRVVYCPVGGEAEHGVITAISGAYVFVRYGDEQHSKGTDRGDLEWVDVRQEPEGGADRGAEARADEPGGPSPQAERTEEAG